MSSISLLRYLSFPLQVAPLILIGVFSVLLSVASPSLFGLPLSILLLVGFVRYCFALLDSIINGATEPPVLSVEMMNPVNEHRVLVAVGITVLLYFAYTFASGMGAVIGMALGVLILVMLPAFTIVQAVTGSIVQAINPVKCIRVMLRLRADYALILVCAIAFYFVQHLIATTVRLPSFVISAIWMYVWLAMFALIGGVAHVRRIDLDVDAASEPEVFELRSDTNREKARDRQVDRIYAEWRSGAQRNAWQTITAQLQHSDDPIAELEWLYERVAAWPDQHLADRVLQELISRLVMARKSVMALKIARERLRMKADFRPLYSSEVVELARLARESGDRVTARLLVSDFEHLFPNDPLQTHINTLMNELR